MFSRVLATLWREGLFSQLVLADVPRWRKNHGSTTVKFYWKASKFSSLWNAVVDN